MGDLSKNLIWSSISPITFQSTPSANAFSSTYHHLNTNIMYLHADHHYPDVKNYFQGSVAIFTQEAKSMLHN